MVVSIVKKLPLWLSPSLDLVETWCLVEVVRVGASTPVLPVWADLLIYCRCLLQKVDARRWPSRLAMWAAPVQSDRGNWSIQSDHEKKPRSSGPQLP